MAKILLAEDDESGRHLIVRMLEKLGHEVVEAENGDVALQALGEPGGDVGTAFAAVLMDLQMPVLDGLDATRRLREMGWSDLPVIAVTAHAMVGDREKCLRAGMNDYLSKPLTLDLLRDILRRWIG